VGNFLLSEEQAHNVKWSMSVTEFLPSISLNVVGIAVRENMNL
jgi:hypothetical protein